MSQAQQHLAPLWKEMNIWWQVSCFVVTAFQSSQPLQLLKSVSERTQEGLTYTWVFNFNMLFVSLDQNLVPTHSFSLISPKIQRDKQPLRTKKITEPLETKFTEPLGTKIHATSLDKKIMQPLLTKRTCNLLGQKIMQPLGTKTRSKFDL